MNGDLGDVRVLGEGILDGYVELPFPERGDDVRGPRLAVELEEAGSDGVEFVAVVVGIRTDASVVSTVAAGGRSTRSAP